MERWQRNEKHDQDVRKVMKRLNLMDSKGRIRAFDGKKVWPELKRLGHTSLGFKECKCAKRAHLRLVK